MSRHLLARPVPVLLTIVAAGVAPVALSASPVIPVAPVRSESSVLPEGTSISLSGYVKLDVLYSQYSEGEVAQGAGRDFYLPNSIPVSAGSGQSRSFFDMHAKETRLIIKSETPLEGHKLGTHIEADFIVNQGAGNELVTNAYNLGFRRAFITFDNWLLGQDWSSFQNLGALPETLDFVGFPADGTVFVRQPQVRYTFGNFLVSLENPETSVLPGGGGSVAASNDARVPDLVLRYNFKLGDSEFAVAALGRQLAVKNPAAAGPPPVDAVDTTATAAGVSISGKIPLGADDLKFQITSGDGLGRYVALGTSADAALNGGALEAIGVTAGYLAYKHAWSPQWRSTLTASHFSADNDTALTGTAVTAKVSSYSANLLYSPVAKLSFGVEYRHATRELESGADGALDRLQFSSKYAF